MRICFLIWLLLSLTAPFAAQAQGKLKVVASFSIIGDMVTQIAGNNVDLKILVGANGDAHEYEPTTVDARSLANADIVFINGLGLEGWIERLIHSSGYKGQVIIVTKSIKTLEADAHGHVADDPHAWQDLANGKIYMINIRDALANADKTHSAEYTKNTALYLKELDALDSWVKSEIAKVPADKRTVISMHDSFQYFALRYGVKFIAPLGISTESQASAADMARIIDQVRKQNITAVFLENMTDSRLIRQLESDAGAHVGGTLYSDAISAPDEPAPNYIAMFRHNVTELVAAMQNNPE